MGRDEGNQLNILLITDYSPGKENSRFLALHTASP
jgi:hypothetical protein